MILLGIISVENAVALIALLGSLIGGQETSGGQLLLKGMTIAWEPARVLMTDDFPGAAESRLSVVVVMSGATYRREIPAQRRL